ncbi:putative ATPase, AAA-type, core, P-loop containing nucleoside triphosphate hydrolase [Medicago truncatula]|uniref:Calmodulin-interacting-like protein n=1 Tax=Medicago truncatula TaxID=3880 RepID=G7L5U3_MEDTR|nr:calmodulin-interacting protein 111 isoform X2 [Medicago truncatula]AES81138.2 calmodulin-interacting-like protein [Medicago truncatula]RHN47693.1 putative ATPase, AAA-type, core, P-loop containing nucleoside triphosphate hydrolase [Medicago truncatula]
MPSSKHSSSSSKKQSSKSKSRLQSSIPDAASTPPRTTTIQLDSLLQHASRIFPSFISHSALVAEITDVESADSLSKGAAKIWLSESSMVASSLAPGSLVSVSIPSSSKGIAESHNFPLTSLTNGLETSKTLDDDVAGNYFAIATVFPSNKVLKDGVRLSLNLFFAMGRPPLGTCVFVHPVHKQSLIYNCKEIYLQLATCKSGTPLKVNNSPSLDLSKSKSRVQTENDIVASPKTPSYGSRFSNDSVYSSPVYEDSASSVTDNNGQSVTSFDVSKALGNESSKKLLETCATGLLYSRCLLLGNLVTVQMLSEFFIFRVMDIKKVSTTIYDYSLNGSSNLNLKDSEMAVENVNLAFTVNWETKVFLSLPSNVAFEESIQRDLSCLKLDNISKLGGLSKEEILLKRIISFSLNDILSRFGQQNTRGVLLHGPPGTGKTSLAQLCAHDAGVNFFSINGPEIVTENYGESEKALQEVFDSAIQAAPAVLFIDKIDAIAPPRKDGGEELSKRLVVTLLGLMDGIRRNEGLVVIAATNRLDRIDPALRRPGRFDKEVEIGVPSQVERGDILRAILGEIDHSLSETQIEELASITHGFVGADLVGLRNWAALICLRRYAEQKLKKTCNASSDDITKQPTPLKSATNSKDHSDETPDHGEEEHILKVTFEDFQKARPEIRPSAMREVTLEVPKVNWEDIGGQKEVKNQLLEAVVWPQKHRDAFTRIGTDPPTAVLMFGPPGCSKTLMARAVASEAGLNFLAVKGPELFSKWVGESEKAVRSLFDKARANAPAIIFFDEIDSLAITRGKDGDGVSVSDRVMAQLLVQLDGVLKRVDVIVIAATNRPDKIDPALLRQGRFDRLLYVGPPNEIDREEIFSIHLRKTPYDSDVSMKELAQLTDGYTGADIAHICRQAALAALEESFDASVVTMKHFKMAIKQVQPSEFQSYQKLSAKFQRAVFSDAI